MFCGLEFCGLVSVVDGWIERMACLYLYSSVFVGAAFLGIVLLDVAYWSLVVLNGLQLWHFQPVALKVVPLSLGFKKILENNLSMKLMSSINTGMPSSSKWA